MVKHTHLCSQYGRGRRIYDLAAGLVYINQLGKLHRRLNLEGTYFRVLRVSPACTARQHMHVVPTEGSRG